MESSTQRFIDSLTRYADNVSERCQDKYGDKKTPLLADGIHLETGEPNKWEEYVTSNLACQQNFLRTLDGLTMLTGVAKYQKQAHDWISYALEELQDSESGMLYWGGHNNYDLLENKPLIGNHELKCVYPYYKFLYRVDPEATTFCIEGIWNKHVRNWSNLLFNRHGDYSAWPKATPWKHDYSGGPLPIIDNTMLSFINTGSDLVYSAGILTKMSGNSEPLLWAKRLAGRYDEVRNESTGLGGYQYNHRDPCRVRISFKKPFSERQDVNETTVLKNGVIQTRYGKAAITWMNLFQELGADGQLFLDNVSKDLTALGKYSYDFSDHSFAALLTDGTKLSPSDCMEGVGYCNPRSLEKLSANGVMLLSYTKAYCLTGNAFFWQIARSLIQGIGWSEVFHATDDKSAELRIDPQKIAGISLLRTGRGASVQDHVCALLALIELYKSTEQKDYLTLAISLGNQLVQEYFNDGFFTTKAKTSEGYASIDNPLPVGLLHLVAAAHGKNIDLPVFYPNSTSFDPKVIISRRKRAQS